MTTKLKSTKKLLWTGLAFLAFLLIIVQLRPSAAKSSAYQILIDRGIVDTIQTAEVLGLDYLSKEPVPLFASSDFLNETYAGENPVKENPEALAIDIANRDLMNAIYTADESISITPSDIPLMFDLGTNSPIRIGQLRDGRKLTRTNYRAVGYVNNSGEPQVFTSLALRGMFGVEASNRGNLAMASDSQHILVADASGTFLEARRVPFLNLIVFDKITKKITLIPEANANAVCRDALNGVLNKTIRRI